MSTGQLKRRRGDSFLLQNKILRFAQNEKLHILIVIFYPFSLVIFVQGCNKVEINVLMALENNIRDPQLVFLTIPCSQ